MRYPRLLLATALAAVTWGLIGESPAEPPAQPYHQWAPTPPLGWNSWDIFGTTITEEQAKQQADAMAEKLLPAGYDVLTVDIQWYEPNARAHVYKPGAKLQMDDHGRLMPAVNRFPSAADGAGFKPLADYVHAKGLRFGIHIMRGIPRQAVAQNTPVLGTEVRAQDIALTDSTCPWNPDMYGVDATKPAGQAYYDSLIELYASWGVDYIKCDDISRPYDDVQQAEIEALRSAIDRSGRAIVLSLSPGATPVSAGEHVSQHANLWRITDDFWDRWGLLHAMFERLHAWEPHRRPGAWPDADMLPIGFVQFGRPTAFTPDEQRTMMSLWAIGRSPLIFGGDMTRIDDFTLEMLTNPEMLRVNQHSTGNHQVSREDDLIVWAADVLDAEGKPTGEKYVALFNAQSLDEKLDLSHADYVSPAIAGNGQSQAVRVDLKQGRQLVLLVSDAGDGFDYDHAAWIDPVLRGPAGELSLTELEPRRATAGWGAVHTNKTCEGQPLLVAGKEATGIGTHSNSTIVYDLPEGYDEFTATGVVLHRGSVEFGVMVTSDDQEKPAESTVSVDLELLGIQGPVQVRDLWKHEDLGEHRGAFSQELPPHGAGLYKVTPVRE